MTIARPTKVGQMQAYFPRSTWSNYRIADRSEIIPKHITVTICQQRA
ncbi:MAG TPA: hypothetical protein VJ323_12650 [Bryobacteraceae bacterium]|nr:hypothetical protein [Bryobacteraceae bacterium]